MRLDHGAVPFLFCCVFRKGGLCDCIETGESGRKGVVVIIDGDDLVPACLLESEDDVRAFRGGQRSIGGGERRCQPM